MGCAPGIPLVLHPRHEPGPVLDAVGAWAASRGSGLLVRAADAARWDGPATAVTDTELAARADAVVSRGAVEVDGTMLRRMEPGETLDVRLTTGCGHMARLDSELREPAPSGSLPGPPRDARERER